MTLRGRISVLAAAALVVVAFGFVATSVALGNWTRALDDRRQGLVLGEDIEQLRNAYLDQETGERGFVITGDDRFLQPYETGRDRADAITARLRTEESGDASFLAVLDDVDRRVAVWRSTVAEPAITARRAAGEQAASEVVDAATSQARFEEVRAALSALEAVADARRVRVEDEQQSSRRVALIWFGITFAAIGAFIAVAVVLLRQWVLVPLNSLLIATRRVRAGAAATVSVVGPPELRDVARAVDEMQRTIAMQRDDALRARVALEQHATLAVQIGAALTNETGSYPDGWTVAAGLVPAEGLVAGDSYSVDLISPTVIGIAVVDISGHGAASALAALKCKELLRAALRSRYEPGHALSWLHRQEGLLSDAFVTAFVALVDTRTGQCRYASGGHPPAVVVGDTTQMLLPTGPLLVDSLAGAAWSTEAFAMAPRSTLVIYTDGLIEARNADREFYGEDRLVELLARSDREEAEPVVKLILDDVSGFQSGRLDDDVTVVAVCHSD